jgi:hypothetical protein
MRLHLLSRTCLTGCLHLGCVYALKCRTYLRVYYLHTQYVHTYINLKVRGREFRWFTNKVHRIFCFEKHYMLWHLQLKRLKLLHYRISNCNTRSSLWHCVPLSFSITSSPWLSVRWTNCKIELEERSYCYPSPCNSVMNRNSRATTEYKIHHRNRST